MKRFFLILPILILISISHGKADAYETKTDIVPPGSLAQATEFGSMDIPHWTIQISKDSFVGMSSVCASIEKARQQAEDSAIGQILQAMGADYHLYHESELSGDLSQSKHTIRERLTYSANWLLNSVQQRIRQYAFQKTGNGYVCFVLVHLESVELDKLKKLTIGAKVSARVISVNDHQAVVEINETNGVSVTLTGYRMTNMVRHDHARLITLFLWKVPELENITREEALPNRVSLNNSSVCVSIPIPNQAGAFKSALLGSKGDISITITGYDEIGRPISVSVGNR